MAKYEPLRRYLARQKTARVELTFTDIERMIGAFLPKAAARPTWWDEMEAAAPTAPPPKAAARGASPFPRPNRRARPGRPPRPGRSA